MGRSRDVDHRLVERMRAQGASWSACANACDVPVDKVRRECDPTYAPPDAELKAAAERAPKLASGRENRPGTWAEPVPIDNRAVPPCANQVAPEKPSRPKPVPQEPTVRSTALAVSVASMPTARAVARALVAAAKVLGEDARQVYIAELPIGRRCRFPAFVALRATYPGCPVGALGRMTGIQTNHTFQIGKARAASWWPVKGEAAVEAALEALERR